MVGVDLGRYVEVEVGGKEEGRGKDGEVVGVTSI